jgi:D-alanyl-D-alanine dipeptidase
MCRLYIIFVLIHFWSPSPGIAQTASPNKYGLPVISNVKTYVHEIQRDSNCKLIELKSLIPTIEYDLKYATTDNFMHRKIYSSDEYTFLRLPAAKALLEVQTVLKQEGVGLKIWDAYRPYSVTEKFWEAVKDERYAANPAKGSGHNRGIAVDVTLIDLKSGRELAMPTGFDNFSDSAHFSFTSLPEDVLRNRQLLKETMETYGFKSFDSEWWHYSWGDAFKFELMDLDFRAVIKANE